jgi:hypothetical protein
VGGDTDVRVTSEEDLTYEMEPPYIPQSRGTGSLRRLIISKTRKKVFRKRKPHRRHQDPNVAANRDQPRRECKRQSIVAPIPMLPACSLPGCIQRTDMPRTLL